MRDVLMRSLVPLAWSGALLAALAVLTLLSWRAKRGSAVHRARLAVLASLVAMAGATVACDRTAAPQDPGPEVEPPQELCYKSFTPDRVRPSAPDAGRTEAPDARPGADAAQPALPRDEPPVRMCYKSISPDRQPPRPPVQPTGSRQPGADAGQPAQPPAKALPPRTRPPEKMCYAL